MNKYKVSVIIATFNTDNYIEECLDSIFAQTMKDIEVIIIDDGSTDNTKLIVKKYLDKYDNCVYRYQDNKGAGIARNNGIEFARGEFLAFMDPDDKYPYDDCIEKLYDVAKKNDVLICGGSISTIELDGSYGVNYKAGSGIIGGMTDTIVNTNQYKHLYGHTRFIYDRELIKQNNIIFGPYKRYEDQMFTMKALGIANKFYELDYSVYLYRIRSEHYTVTESVFVDIMKGIRDTFYILEQYNMKSFFDYNFNNLIMCRMNKIVEYESNEELNTVLDDLDGIARRCNQIVKKYIEKDDITLFRLKAKENEEIFENIIKSKKKVVLYGAGENTIFLLKSKPEIISYITGIAVSNCDGNETRIEGLEVKNITEFIEEKNNVMIVVTVSEKYKDEIMGLLQFFRFEDVKWLNMLNYRYMIRS